MKLIEKHMEKLQLADVSVNIRMLKCYSFFVCAELL